MRDELLPVSEAATLRRGGVELVEDGSGRIRSTNGGTARGH